MRNVYIEKKKIILIPFTNVFLYQRLCVQDMLIFVRAISREQRVEWFVMTAMSEKQSVLHPSNQGPPSMYNLLIGAKRGLLKCGSNLKEFVTMKANCGALSQVNLG